MKQQFFALGSNFLGQLCISEGTDKNNENKRIKTLTKVVNLQIFIEKYKVEIKKIINGDKHTFFLLRNEITLCDNENIKTNVFAIGSNVGGQLGIGNTIDQNQIIPIDIGFINTLENTKDEIEDIICGNFHTLFLTRTGKIYGTGSNSNGQLGLSGSDVFIVRPKLTALHDCTDIDSERRNIIIDKISTTYTHTCCLSKQTNTVYYFGMLNGEKVKMKTIDYFNNSNIIIDNIYCGYHFTIFLTESHKVYIFGKINEYVFTTITELIIPNNEILKDIAVGGFHLIVLTKDNTVYGMGSNSDGQLLQLKKETLLFTNIDYFTKNNIFIDKIFCGPYHTTFLNSNQKIFYSCGWNGCGQLGSNDCESSSIPVMVNKLNAWKFNEYNIVISMNNCTDSIWVILNQENKRLIYFFKQMVEKIFSANFNDITIVL
ncbi:hypothetical protein ABK040_005314 [Willaertia magna]